MAAAWTAVCLASRAFAARRLDIIGGEACKCRMWEGVSANQRGPTAMTCSRPGCRYRRLSASSASSLAHLKVTVPTYLNYRSGTMLHS